MSVLMTSYPTVSYRPADNRWVGACRSCACRHEHAGGDCAADGPGFTTVDLADLIHDVGEHLAAGTPLCR